MQGEPVWSTSCTIHRPSCPEEEGERESGFSLCRDPVIIINDSKNNNYMHLQHGAAQMVCLCMCVWERVFTFLAELQKYTLHIHVELVLWFETCLCVCLCVRTCHLWTNSHSFAPSLGDFSTSAESYSFPTESHKHTCSAHTFLHSHTVMLTALLTVEKAIKFPKSKALIITSVVNVHGCPTSPLSNTPR